MHLDPVLVSLPSAAGRVALLAATTWGVAAVAAYGIVGAVPWWAPVVWWVSVPFLVLILVFLAVSRRVAQVDESGLDVSWAPWGVGGFHLPREEILGITLTPLGAPDRQINAPWTMEVHTRSGPRSLGAEFPSARVAKSAATDLRQALGLLEDLE